MGSVTKNLIHTVDCPVIAVNPLAAKTANSEKVGPIIVPVDVDYISPQVIEVASKLALKHDTSIHLLHALSNYSGFKGITGGYGDRRVYRSYETFYEEETKIALKAFDEIEKLIQKDSSASEVRYHIYETPAHEAIADCCKDNPNSLVVIQTHVKAGLDRFFLGSTAERTIHSVNAPVLILNKKVFQRIKDATCSVYGLS